MSAGKFKDTLKKISDDFGIQLQSFSSLSGGDINEVFLIESKTEKFVVKLNNAEQFPGMFEAEQNGLKKLLQPGAIDIPKPIKTGYIDSYSYLILEYKSQSSKSPDFWKIFGEQLALLHQNTSPQFGLETSNYIGSLPQYNDNRSSAGDFYIEMRLQPQIEQAKKNGFPLNIPAQFYKNCERTIPDESASLIHGDLWNGNFLVNSMGHPCLIDPAVAYASREMDLGMMKLFGGFSDELFDTYQEIFPLENGWKDRLDLWQLYYLLVHLNIFGAGYKQQVISIIEKYR